MPPGAIGFPKATPCGNARVAGSGSGNFTFRVFADLNRPGSKDKNLLSSEPYPGW